MATTQQDAAVAFPGQGSTSALGRAVVQAALADVDPAGARSAAGETNWHRGYLTHFRRVAEAGLESADAERTAADRGLAEFIGQMRWEDGPLADVPAGQPTLGSERVTGSAAPITELALPLGGDLLTGADLSRQLDRWVTDGVVEPSVATAVRTVAAHPEWLSLPGRTLVALGAGAEIGPAPTLLRWGATVVGVDLPDATIWRRLLDTAAQTAGTLVVPTREGAADLAARAGADLLTDLPALITWLRGQPGPLVLGNYVYADGGTNVRASAAADVLASALRETAPDLTLAFLATPTDVFLVPRDVVEHATRQYDERGRLARTLGRGLRAATAGRLLQRNYPPGADPGVHDALVPQQGPNYALGKRVQRWRATVERTAGRPVSLNIAPPTRTRSVIKNGALAAAYAGAHRFGVEVFEPATTRVLMAVLLVHDLHADRPTFDHPWQEEAHQAAHGGLWRAAYSPRSALGLAALLGYGSVTR